MVPIMPDVQKLPLRERDAARAAWLRANGIQHQNDAAGIKRAWDRERYKRNAHAWRERERAAKSRDAPASTPLPSSVHRAQRRVAQRNAEEGRQLFGLFVDVPWSAWEGYEEGTRCHRGMVWDYNRDTKRFTIRFPPDGEYDCEDIGLTWQELLGEAPCHASATQRAHLHELEEHTLSQQPRGHRPRDATWDQRKGAWVDCNGHEYDPGDDSLTRAMNVVCSQLTPSDLTALSHLHKRLEWSAPTGDSN